MCNQEHRSRKTETDDASFFSHAGLLRLLSLFKNCDILIDEELSSNYLLLLFFCLCAFGRLLFPSEKADEQIPSFFLRFSLFSPPPPPSSLLLLLFPD